MIKKDYKVKRTDSLTHHGILGMKWGKRNGPPYPLSPGDHSASEKKAGWQKSLGSKTDYYRVGRKEYKPNEVGVTYVATSTDDAARYVKYLGSTPIRKIFGLDSDHLLKLKKQDNIKTASEDVVNKLISQKLLEDKTFLKKFNDSFYRMAISYDEIDVDYIKRAINNPKDKEAKRLGYAVTSLFESPDFKEETISIFNAFRKNGYDAIPDIRDIMSGTSETATIILNPEKLTLESSLYINKNLMVEAKQLVKIMGKLPISELLDYD